VYGGADSGCPYLVACAYIMRGTRRANSETGQFHAGRCIRYGNIKSVHELAKDAFDAFNNQGVFAPQGVPPPCQTVVRQGGVPKRAALSYLQHASLEKTGDIWGNIATGCDHACDWNTTGLC
jgi:hypothetical protein